MARDVDVDLGKVYVAMGGDGVDVFDAFTPDALAPAEMVAIAS